MKKSKNLLKRAPALVLSVALVGGLMSPAFAKTIETTRVCGKEEHTHTDACYEHTVSEELVCEVEETEAHEHTDLCYTQVRELTCEESTEAHAHSEECCDEEGNVVCELSTEPAHSHNSDCYTLTRELSCEVEKTEGHKHSEACYVEKVSEDAKLVCELEEHTHSTDCYVYVKGEQQLAYGAGAEEAMEKDIQYAVEDDTSDEAKKVTVILNGIVLKMTDGIVVQNGKTLIIEDGEITGGTLIAADRDNSRVITVLNDGTVNLEGGTLTGGNATGGGAIYVGKDGELNMSGGEITGNHSKTDGGGVLVEGGKFTMTGGEISNNTAKDSGGGVVVRDVNDKYEDLGGEAIFVMSGGTISGNSTDTKNWHKDYSTGIPEGQGGGVFVGQGGTLIISGDAVISNNEAGEGGGIYVAGHTAIETGKYKDEYSEAIINGDNGKLEMNGGTVHGNIARLGEGGGIYIDGEGKITAGNITNNVTYSERDLGGGGIYIENRGRLVIENVEITGNEANGLGGGLAACVHGKTTVFAEEGAAIYDNTANGNKDGFSTNTNGIIDGYNAWDWRKDDPDKADFRDSAQDIFTASDPNFKDTSNNGNNTGGAVVGNVMLGWGLANWEGYKANHTQTGDAKKNFTMESVDGTNNATVHGDRFVSLTANPDEAAKQAAHKTAKVFITGNISMNTHGGGIANNGVLIMGLETDGVNSYPDLELKKNLTEKVDQEPEADSDQEKAEPQPKRELKDGEFEFVLLDKDGKEVGTMKHDANGDAKYQFNSQWFKQFDKDTEVTLTVKEIIPAEDAEDRDENVIFDKSEYQVKFTVTVKEQVYKIGPDPEDSTRAKKYTVINRTVGDFSYWLVVDENGNKIEAKKMDGLVFNNQYTVPEDPDRPGGDDPDPTPPGNDPDPDPEPPTPPTPEDPNEPPTPPEEEFEDPQVPLSDRPDEDPEEDLEDPDVPLADVPMTGDISGMWYVAAILSVCGLAVVFVSKKREDSAI